MPLTSRLEDQVAYCGLMLLTRSVVPDTTVKDEAELILLGVSVHRRGD
jgi:hypothetical protein